MQESYYALIEDFDDFRAFDGLNAPHKYKLQLAMNTSGGSLFRDGLLRSIKSLTKWRSMRVLQDESEWVSTNDRICGMFGFESAD